VIDPLLPVVDAIDPTHSVVDPALPVGSAAGSAIGSATTSMLATAASLQLSAISLLWSDQAAVAGTVASGTASAATTRQTFAEYLVGAGSGPSAANTASSPFEITSGQIVAAPAGSNIAGAGLPVPGPGPVPGPNGVPGCPGAAGGTAGFAGCLQIPALTPASGAGAVALVGSTDDEHFAALLGRADEPGASPD
jgi:hypothetical protein